MGIAKNPDSWNGLQFFKGRFFPTGNAFCSENISIPEVENEMQHQSEHSK
jgi:hypothetical protein